MDESFPNAVILLLTLLTAFIVMDLTRRHSVSSGLKQRHSYEKVLDTTIVVIAGLLGIYILRLSDFTLNLDLSSIYERRLAVREHSSWWSGYILSFCRSVITVALIYLFLVKKNMLALLTLIICSIGIFSYDGTKSALIVPIFLAAIYYISFHGTARSYNIIGLVLLLIIVSILEFVFLDYNNISTLFIRRAIAGPGFLNTVFWEYYSMHDKVLMTDSIGRYLVDSHDKMAATFTIGYYLNSPEMNANTGIWMGGYTHFGLIGIIIIPAIAGFILGLIDNLTKTRYQVLGFLVCTYMGVLWAEQMLHTSMLSGGILFIIMFLMLYCSTSQGMFNKPINMNT